MSCPIKVRSHHVAMFTKDLQATSTKVIFFNDPNGNTVELQQSFRPGEY